MGQGVQLLAEVNTSTQRIEIVFRLTQSILRQDIIRYRIQHGRRTVILAGINLVILLNKFIIVIYSQAIIAGTLRCRDDHYFFIGPCFGDGIKQLIFIVDQRNALDHNDIVRTRLKSCSISFCVSVFPFPVERRSNTCVNLNLCKRTDGTIAGISFGNYARAHRQIHACGICKSNAGGSGEAGCALLVVPVAQFFKIRCCLDHHFHRGVSVHIARTDKASLQAILIIVHRNGDQKCGAGGFNIAFFLVDPVILPCDGVCVIKESLILFADDAQLIIVVRVRGLLHGDRENKLFFTLVICVELTNRDVFHIGIGADPILCKPAISVYFCKLIAVGTIDVATGEYIRRCKGAIQLSSRHGQRNPNISAFPHTLENELIHCAGGNVAGGQLSITADFYIRQSICILIQHIFIRGLAVLVYMDRTGITGNNDLIQAVAFHVTCSDLTRVDHMIISVCVRVGGILHGVDLGLIDGCRAAQRFVNGSHTCGKAAEIVIIIRIGITGADGNCQLILGIQVEIAACQREDRAFFHIAVILKDIGNNLFCVQKGFQLIIYRAVHNRLTVNILIQIQHCNGHIHIGKCDIICSVTVKVTDGHRDKVFVSIVIQRINIPGDTLSVDIYIIPIIRTAGILLCVSESYVEVGCSCTTLDCHIQHSNIAFSACGLHADCCCRSIVGIKIVGFVPSIAGSRAGI